MRHVRTLFLARHGETDWNAAGRWQGQTDVPLNENGRAQARALAMRLRDHGITAVATSDLLRARVTAEIVASELGLAVDLDPGLRERAFGRFEGLTRAECEQRFPDAWARYLGDPHPAPPDGEPHDAFLARLVAALRRAADRRSSPALVVTHGGAMRALLRARLAYIPSPAAPAWRQRGIPNGGLFRLRLAGGEIVEAEPLDPPR